ncbi:MAG TPA: diguanylate cyclase [Kaistiaceae bacterium]|nr:diguanylate cyclase [Kaistiaceae bacterium]
MEILLIEPSRVGRKMMGQMLEQRGDVVHPFALGGEALDHLRKHPEIEVIITSVEIQGICGLELCWEARVLSNSRNPLYIVVMSSNWERRKAIEALDSGADDFIQKPPDRDELFARLRAADRLLRTQRENHRLARTDPLTGAFNRRHFFDQLRQEIETHGADPLSVVLMDIDHFKKVNDTYGHDVGDLVICQVAGLLIHADGVFGRIGGEEFAWLLPRCSEAAAVEKAERIRRAVEGMTIGTELGPLNVTCSFGVACRLQAETAGSLVKRADEALYGAKHSGRNAVAMASIIDGLRNAG